MADAKNSDKMKKIEFPVFPNTGHHYLFIPFEKEWLSKYDKDRLLMRRCQSDKAPWRRYEGKDSASGELKKYTWIRTRLGVDSNKTPGMWLAVETNVGTIRRGTFYDKREITKGDMPASEEERMHSPYAYSDIMRISVDSDKDSYDVQLKVPNPGNEGPSELPVATIEIVWQKQNPARTDVDLIVDFGNTRTVVLALENNKDASKDELRKVCFPLPFISRGHECPGHNVDENSGVRFIADSWFLLQEPMFAEHDMPLPGEQDQLQLSKEYETKTETKTIKVGTLFGPKEKTIEETKYYVTERVPQMFVEISPVIMGEEAGELLTGIDLERGENLSMSSPKRYLWDNAPCGGVENAASGIGPWCMNHNRWSNRKRRDAQSVLNGQICRYMYMEGDNNWDIEHPPYENEDIRKRPTCAPEQPTYPRSMAMMWSALYVIESSFRQITSYSWRKGNSEFNSRRLRSVNVTFPSGWTATERESYKRAWEQAVNIFTLSHLDSRKDVSLADAQDARPRIQLELDEAVASQLPFIHSEVRRLQGANAWIKLYGRPDGTGKHRIRVMTVDIGGGTMDSSIVEYRNSASGSQIALRYRILFRDCNSFAGDKVVLGIIQRVLLPSILEAKGVDEDDEIAEKFISILGASRVMQKDRSKWQRITKMFFVPMVRSWLSDVANCKNGIYRDEETGEEFRKVGDVADETAVNEFNAYLKEGGLDSNFVQPDDKLKYDPGKINQCIYDGLEDGMAPLGKFVASYDVDVVTLSGKISEMPKVQEMLREALPICAQRVIPMKDYVAGDWYPMSNDGRISDAKTVTAVGAALFVAGRNGLINDWHLREESRVDDGGTREAGTNATRNYWGVMKRGGKGVTYGFSGAPFLSRDMKDNGNEEFMDGDGVSHKGAEVMVDTYIGRAKYNTRDARVEQQYYFKWVGKDPKTGEPRKRPDSPLAVVFKRCEEKEDDSIEIESVEATNPDEDGTIGIDDVRLELCTLSREGFWMDECKFEVDFGND